MVARLWSTARLTTVDGEAFFAALPEGGVAPALSFALLCELMAIASLLLILVGLCAAVAPEVVLALASVRTLGVPFFATALLAAPLFALVMVALHVVWGATLELGLRLSGARARPAHALRYALYACGWDLVTSPFGFAAGWVVSGLPAATLELRAALRIPGCATRAYLRRGRALNDRNARRALVTAVVLTGGLVVGAAAALGVAIVVAMV